MAVAVSSAFLVLVVSACSKSSGEVAFNAATSVTEPLMQTLVEKDASRDWLDRSLIADMPKCSVYKQRLRVAGRGLPADRATQLAISRARPRRV
jgi:hypothetical protein